MNAGSFVEYATADGRLHQTPPDNIAPRNAEPVFRADRASQEERNVDGVLESLRILRDACPAMSRAFTEGGCIRFALAMQAIFPNAEILYDMAHAVVRVGAITFDVNGPAEASAASRPISRESEGDERWAKLLALGPVDQEERIREDERDRLLAKATSEITSKTEMGRKAFSAAVWLSNQDAMPPADRARVRGDAS